MRIVAFLVCFGFAPPAMAHELGVTQAVATIDNRTYRIDISIDPDALLARLEVAGGLPISGSIQPAERDERIASLGAVFLEGVRIRFDDRAVTPSFHYQTGTTSQTPSTVSLNGRLPHGARAWTLEYQFAMGWFSVETRNGGALLSTTWVEGGKASPPIQLAEKLTWQPRAAAPLVLLGIAAIGWRRRSR
jgi:hypothetical protein